MGIEDPEVAFAFDMECSNVLTEWEIERESKAFEAMSVGMVSRALSSAKVEVERKPIVLNA